MTLCIGHCIGGKLLNFIDKLLINSVSDTLIQLFQRATWNARVRACVYEQDIYRHFLYFSVSLYLSIYLFNINNNNNKDLAPIQKPIQPPIQ